MLPILTKPLLQYGVEEAISADIKNMAIVTGRGKRAIEDHFDSSYELESQLAGTKKEQYIKEITEIIDNTSFTYIRQKKILGLGDAILTGEPLIGNEAFAVILADDLCVSDGKGVISQLIEIYNKYKCSVIAIQEVPLNQTKNYGIITGELIDNSNDIYRVSSMIEKPNEQDTPSTLAIIGRYILTPDIFELLKNIPPGSGGEIQITDALSEQAKQGKVIAYKFSGRRFDCGSVEGFVDATNHFAKKNIKPNY
jgi:UTP--glucose-1-phosphate uridylyltransferase